MERQDNAGTVQARLYNPQALAYVGDAAYELKMRELLLKSQSCSSRQLHSKAIGYVNSHAQAKAAEYISDMLNDEETEILKRGRNAHVGHVSKGSNTYLYHMATALECLFGFLHMESRTQRIDELSKLIYDYLTKCSTQE